MNKTTERLILTMDHYYGLENIRELSYVMVDVLRYKLTHKKAMDFSCGQALGLDIWEVANAYHKARTVLMRLAAYDWIDTFFEPEFEEEWGEES